MKIDGDLRKLFRKHLPQVHWTSIETGGTGLGVPDSYGAADGAMFWVEYKLTAGWTCRLLPEQVGWHMSHARRGGRSFIAARRRHDGGPRKGPRCDELWLFYGSAAQDICMFGFRGCPPESTCGIWKGGPAAWDWADVIGHLTRPLPHPPT